MTVLGIVSVVTLVQLYKALSGIFVTPSEITIEDWQVKAYDDEGAAFGFGGGYDAVGFAVGAVVGLDDACDNVGFLVGNVVVNVVVGLLVG